MAPIKNLSTDMFDLLRLFNEHGVEYLVVGAHAVNTYTEARLTKDLDVWVNPTKVNAKRVFAALKDFGAPIATATEADFADEESFFVIGVKPNRVDILKKVSGVNFADSWGKKKSVQIDGLELFVLSLEDTIKAKLSAGRPQDLLDVKKLNLALKAKN